MKPGQGLLKYGTTWDNQCSPMLMNDFPVIIASSSAWSRHASVSSPISSLWCQRPEQGSDHFDTEAAAEGLLHFG